MGITARDHSVAAFLYRRKILHEPPFSLLDNGETLAQRFGRRGLFENRPDQTGDVIAFNSEKIAHPSMRPGPDLTD